MFYFNIRSEIIANERNKNLSMEIGDQSMISENKFDFLFEDAKRRLEYKEKVKEKISDNECTFKPNTYESRQTNSTRRSKTLSRKIRPVEAPEFNVFKPKIGRAPKNNRNVACLPIGDYLYAQNKMKEELMTKIRAEDVAKSKMDCNSSFVRRTSNQIVEGKKEEIFRMIFDLLDKDGDGKISVRSICITRKVYCEYRITC